MKKPTKKQREAARMASPHPEDRFTDKEENEMYEQGYQALRRKLATDSTAGPEQGATGAPGAGT
jgi:RNA polymerase-binding transcription factor DksA